MRKLLVLSVLLLSAATLGAQKIDSRLTSLVPRPGTSATRRAQAEQPSYDPEVVQRTLNVTFGPDGTVETLSAIAHMKKGQPCPKAKIEALGITVNDVIGSIALLSVPAERLYLLEGVGEIERVEADKINHLHNDNARSQTQATHLADTPLSEESSQPAWQQEGFKQPYTGQGVVVGVIDVGIDFNHMAFKDSEGNSRVKLALAPSVSSKPGSSLKAYTTLDEIATLTADNTSESHGTHTSATAAGSAYVSSNLNRQVQGFAPEADLVLCGMGSSLADSRIIEGIKTVFSYADQEGQPAVVNLSLGSNVEMKNGTAALNKAINEFTLNGTKPGRIVVFSAGNEGGDNISIDQTLGSPAADGYQLRTVLEGFLTTSTDLRKTESTPNYNIQYPNGIDAIFYTLDTDPNLQVYLEVVDMSNGKLYSLDDKPLHVYNKTANTIAAEATSPTVSDPTVQDGRTYITVKSSGMLVIGDGYEKNLRLALFVKGTAGKYLRVICSDDLWFSQPKTDGGTLDATYTPGTPGNSINTFACSDAVISVGAYKSRGSWKGVDGVVHYYTGGNLSNEVSSVAYFSSYGTDDYGISRPDILAPGTALLSAYNRYDTSSFHSDDGTPIDGLLTDLFTDDNSSYYYGVMQGTSMAAPCMTGIIALWLQQDPTLSATDVRRLLRLTAQNDEYTTDLTKIPSHDLHQVGMGRVDALAGMKHLVNHQANTLTLADNADNSTGIRQAAGQSNMTVTLQGRNFYKDGYWNTLCLPFDVDLGQSPLCGDGLTVKALDPENCSLSADGVLTLHFADVASPSFTSSETTSYVLKAGTPYLIKWDNLTAYQYNTGVNPTHTIENPTFRYVTVSNAAPTAITLADGSLTFQGTYAPLSIPAGGDPSTLYLGAENKLYYPASDEVSLHAQRAYFHVKDGNSGMAAVRSIVLDLGEDSEQGEATGIDGIRLSDLGSWGESVGAASSAWFTLQGVRLSTRPAAPGIYLHRGRKVLVK